MCNYPFHVYSLRGDVNIFYLNISNVHLAKLWYDVGCATFSLSNIDVNQDGGFFSQENLNLRLMALPTWF